MCSRPRGAGPDPQSSGVIESWTTDANGLLDRIRVRWDDGELTEHSPYVEELWRP